MDLPYWYIASVSSLILVDWTTSMVAYYTLALSASDPLALYRAQYQCTCWNTFNSVNNTLALGNQTLTYNCVHIFGDYAAL